MINKTETQEKISKLVEKYKRLTSQRKKSYNEADTRRDFIMPFFQALGWDIYNDFTENEVAEEETSITGRIDYSFRINNITQFVLEAKAIHEDLDKEQWAKQAVEYGWNKGISWVVLTDFEGLKVFNSEWKKDHPQPSIDLKYKEYLDKFDRLWLLSKDSFEKNELDSKASEWGITAKRESVNERLAKDLLEWREVLTKYFSLWNKKIDLKDIEESVQRILDRLIFMRVVEDKDIEEKRLWQTFKEWESKDYDPQNFIEKLTPIFREFDKKYNSNLFEKHLCEDLYTTQEPFMKILPELYGSKEAGLKYRFDAINADVLGSVYEQYLGYVQDREREKSKRKKQGIYYTPTYIVDYIVQNTLGKLLEEKKLTEIDNVKVLDPTCGSGSFLIKAFDVLNEKIKKERGNKNGVQAALRKYRILTSNIYGVDLDPQAVEIARLNLLLKALEPDNKLPVLSDNIKNGNSLIEDKKIDEHAFVWTKEFKKAFEDGGFDVIIGNPPYIKEDTNRSAFDGLHDSPYYQGKMDIWTLFACRAIDLLKDGGYFSFIAPSSWIGSAGASIFREKILGSGEIIKFVDFSDFRVFKDASIQTMIFIFQKKNPRKSYTVQYAKITNKNTDSEAVARLLASGLQKQVENSIIYEATIKSSIAGKSISFSNDVASEVLDKIEKIGNFKLFKNDIGNGIDVLQDFVSEKHLPKLTDETIHKGDGVLVLKNSVVAGMKLNDKELEYLKPYYTTSQINRYLSDKENIFKIIYADKYFRAHINEFPNLKKHIDRFKEILTSAFAPYGLHRPRQERFFKGKTIFLLRKTMFPAFTYVDFPCYVTRAFLVLKPEGINLKYLAALLNSRLIYFWLKHKGKKQGEQLQIDKEPLMDIPLLKVDKKEQERIAVTVDAIMTLNAEFHKTSENTDKWHSLKAEIERSERRIDEKFYKLYGLKPKEIEIIKKN